MEPLLKSDHKQYRPLAFTLCLDAESAATLALYGTAPNDSWTARRDGLVVRMLLSTGLRRAELASLTINNIRAWGKRSWLEFAGKGGRSRWVPLHRAILEERKKLVADIGIRFFRPSPMPFIPALLGMRVTQISGRTIYDAVRRASERTLGNKVHPHTLRHTCATLMLATRAPLAGVQGILGHSDLRTTARYLHLLPETLLMAASDAFYEAIGIEAGMYAHQQSIRFPKEAVR